MIVLGAELLFLAASIGVLILICMIRAILGPTTPDRVVALDTTNTLVVAALVMLGVAFQEVIYIDVAVVYAMLSFVTTMYISKYLEGGS
jgi:multicomponent Na+:H+ antiporter subunit F